MAEERLVKSSSGSHWYTPDGQPCYEVPYADKKRADMMRPTTLADAKKMNLRPSVTTILSIIHKQDLENWIIEQAMLSCLTLPRLEGESDALFVRRLREDAKSIAREAAALGTATHRAIERWMTHQEFSEVTYGYETGDKLAAFVGFWTVNFGAAKYRVETPFACEAGYGGKIDIETDGAIIDVKTKTTKKGEKIKMFPEQGMQLAAYGDGVGAAGKRLINIVISTTEPGRIEMVEWTDKREGLYKCFMNAFEVWKYINSYDPMKPQKGKDKKNDGRKKENKTKGTAA